MIVAIILLLAYVAATCLEKYLTSPRWNKE